MKKTRQPPQPAFNVLKSNKSPRKMEQGEIAGADHGTAFPSFSLLVFVGDKTTTKEKERKEGGQKNPGGKTDEVCMGPLY